MLVNQGFVFRRSGLSTDSIVILVIGATSTAWTASILYHAYYDSPNSSGKGTLPLWSGKAIPLYPMSICLIEAPILVQTLFILWVLKCIPAVWASRSGNSPNLWRSLRTRSPFDWESGLGYYVYTLLFTTTFITVGTASAVAIAAGGPHTTSGILSLAGLIVFFFNGTPRHPYNAAPHSYASDTLRIILPTMHHEGTVYQLPSADRGFDAIWSPKISNEHREADGEIMLLFQHMRCGRWLPHEPLERLRATLARFHARVILSPSEARLLADFIYPDLNSSNVSGEGSRPESFRSLHCKRAEGVHLIGRDLLFALCHAEYLVFMSQHSLPDETCAKLHRLRLMSRSGATSSPTSSPNSPDHTIGFLPGLAGYREAARYVYAIFALPVDASALHFDVAPPVFSAALGKAPPDIEAYVAELWDLSMRHCEGTFSALWFFATVWFMEMGNVNGFHIFPLRCDGREGDMVAQGVMWRQAWFSACVAQIISCSGVVFGAFVGGAFP